MSQIVDDMSTIAAIVLGSGYPSASGPWSRICAFVKEAQPHADNYLSTIGERGGSAGTGDAKKRGDSEHYKKMRAAREAKKVGVNVC